MCTFVRARYVKRTTRSETITVEIEGAICLFRMSDRERCGERKEKLRAVVGCVGCDVCALCEAVKSGAEYDKVKPSVGRAWRSIVVDI